MTYSSASPGMKEIIATLEADWPKWQIWVVYRAVDGPVWCARLWDDHDTVINAFTHEHLVEYLTEAETPHD